MKHQSRWNLLVIPFAVIVMGMIPAFGTLAQTDAPRPLEDILPAFESLIESEMAYYHIPGMAVAIVQGNEIVYARGFGLRDVENNLPFSTDTRFLVGSTTKSMTSLLVAQMVERGVLTWDTPVTDILPGFRTSDDALTEQITVRDLMGMGTGLESSPIAALNWGEWTVDDMLNAIAEQAVGGDFGEHYAYNNEVYALAGYAALSALGDELTSDAYAALINDSLFEAIGMPSALVGDDQTHVGGDVAYPYETPILGDTEGFSRMTVPPIGVVAPSGAVWMNVEDMARYVITQKNGGITPDGTRIVDESILAETWIPGVTVDFDAPGVTDPAYGMGWVSLNYHDLPILYHDGGWQGYSTQMMIYPSADVGVVLFANSTAGSSANYALSFGLLELLYGLEPAAVEHMRGEYDTFMMQINQLRALVPDTAVSAEDAEGIVGAYSDGWAVEHRDDNTLWINYGEWNFQIVPLPPELVPNMYIAINNGGAGTFITLEQTETETALSLALGTDELRIVRQNE